jgi:hypothetical protein
MKDILIKIFRQLLQLTITDGNSWQKEAGMQQIIIVVNQ